MSRIYLSKADVTDLEADLVLNAVLSGWVAPAGPHVDAFEAEMADRVGVRAALALASGTAALHLALLGVGAGPGNVVVCSTMTFAASANAIVYTGATPVFVDSVLDDGNVDASLMLTAIDDLRREGVTVAAALVVDLFGRCADYRVLSEGLAERSVPMVEDAAESLGARFEGRSAGSFGHAAALSFNGNKVMTTSGGGMLLSNDVQFIARARYLSTQARQNAGWYEHTEVGYNYRLSNILAALGRGQLQRLNAMIDRRRAIRYRYVQALGQIPGVRFLTGSCTTMEHEDNCWLTTIELNRGYGLPEPAQVIAELEKMDIEARRLWKPMHLQPAFRHARHFSTGQAEHLFNFGLALPSGSSMTDLEVSRVVDCLQRTLCP